MSGQVQCDCSILIGAPASGKSTYAVSFFGDVPTRILSSDRFRAIVSDDEERMDVSRQAFDLLHTILDYRLANGHDTCVDSTAINPEARKKLLMIAKKYPHVTTFAVVFNVPLEVLLRRNDQRQRHVPQDVIARMYEELQLVTEAKLYQEGFDHVQMIPYPYAR